MEIEAKNTRLVWAKSYGLTYFVVHKVSVKDRNVIVSNIRLPLSKRQLSRSTVLTRNDRD